MKPLVLLAILLPLSAAAYERDVHYGLTRWLALQAGFDASDAESIAVADERIDGGLLDTQTLTLEYACLTGDVAVAREVQHRHYPAATAVPAPPAQRAVVAGSPAARQALADLGKGLKGKEGLMLGKLGAALHPLQDSWSHQGVPGMPNAPEIQCDTSLASSHPRSAAEPNPHTADLTHWRTQDAVAMARATYDALAAYPQVQGRARTAANWASLVPAVEAFAKAGTKTHKRQWFADNGVTDTTFLEGISLPDGNGAGPLKWSGGKLPLLAAAASNQHEVPPDLRSFFDTLLLRWLGPEAVETVLAEAGGVADATRKGGVSAPTRELTARMKLWKLSDHGSAAVFAHAPRPLDSAQLKQAQKLGHAAGAYVMAASVADAVLPLQAIGPRATPLLPYLVHVLPGEPMRAIALLRLRNAPYDTLALVVNRRDGRWTLVDVHAAVEP